MECLLDDIRERIRDRVDFLATRLHVRQKVFERAAAFLEALIEFSLRMCKIGSGGRKRLLLMRDRLEERLRAADGRIRIVAEHVYPAIDVVRRVLEIGDAGAQS